MTLCRKMSLFFAALEVYPSSPVVVRNSQVAEDDDNKRNWIS